MSGQSCIRGMRLTVRRVAEAVAHYPDRAEITQEYLELKDNDIRQALEFAASSLDDYTPPYSTRSPSQRSINGRTWSGYWSKIRSAVC
jgi:uncharacterized protein (DUF433 family)